MCLANTDTWTGVKVARRKRAGLAISKNHSEECRARIMYAMGGDEGGRRAKVANDERFNRRIVVREAPKFTHTDPLNVDYSKGPKSLSRGGARALMMLAKANILRERSPAKTMAPTSGLKAWTATWRPWGRWMKWIWTPNCQI